MTRTAPLRVITPAPAPVARHHRLRLALGVVAVLAVLAGGGVLAGTWVLQQYYVGASDGRVAIFQGVRGDVLGLPLQKVVETTDIALTDLPETTRNTVEDGVLVTEGGLGGAQRRVDMLRSSMLAPCPDPAAAPPVTQPPITQPPAPPTAADPGALPTAPAQPGAEQPGALPEGQPQPGALPPTAVSPADPAAPGAAPGGDTTPLPTVAPEPGLTCRKTG